ncbi:DnaD domain-containing protein [Vagococcus luciliae]|uniref:DNA replication protein DnaD n=1 Tax=Vagococcus luciliae TaxID=2920380 RepID=A0ABY5P1H2_9ENTE|nr:DnaD domain protein [Vagococcus luciliae]UUV99780.1 DNA replication protein DnaD [Vagococcus luciliae]
MLSLDYYLNSGTTTVSNLLFKYYKKIGMTDSEMILYLQLLQCSQKGNDFPTMDIIAQYMGITNEIGYQMVQQLMTKGVLSIETSRNEFGKTEDRYDLTLVYEKIENVMTKEAVQTTEKIQEDKKVNLFNKFEQEFGRSLSPIEMETIQQWLNEDKYSVELIELALREAILNQAYSLKYMDRILLNWERKNLHSKQAIQKDQKQRLKEIDEKKQTTTDEKLPEIPMYNWLNPHDK